MSILYRQWPRGVQAVTEKFSLLIAMTRNFGQIRGMTGGELSFGESMFSMAWWKLVPDKSGRGDSNLPTPAANRFHNLPWMSLLAHVLFGNSAGSFQHPNLAEHIALPHCPDLASCTIAMQTQTNRKQTPNRKHLQEVLNPTPLNPTPATCHKRKRKLRCSFRKVALQKLHCNIRFFCSAEVIFTKKLRCSKRNWNCNATLKKLRCTFLPLSCRFQAPQEPLNPPFLRRNGPSRSENSPLRGETLHYPQWAVFIKRSTSSHI